MQGQRALIWCVLIDDKWLKYIYIFQISYIYFKSVNELFSHESKSQIFYLMIQIQSHFSIFTYFPRHLS